MLRHHLLPLSLDCPHEPPSPLRWRLVCCRQSPATGGRTCPASSWRSRASSAPRCSRSASAALRCLRSFSSCADGGVSGRPHPRRLLVCGRSPRERSPPARHIAHVIASVADNASGRATVYLTWLTEATGMSRSAVAKHLNTLEHGGWVKRRRSRRAAAMLERTGYATLIPPGSPFGASPSYGLGLCVKATKQRPVGLSTTSTKAGAPSAGASGAAARSIRDALPTHRTPTNLGRACGCTTRGKSADGECFACGGRVA